MHCASNLVLGDGEGSPEEGALELESEEGLREVKRGEDCSGTENSRTGVRDHAERWESFKDVCLCPESSGTW